MTQLSYIFTTWSCTGIVKKKKKRKNSLNILKCSEGVRQRVGILTTGWKRQLPTAFTFPPLMLVTSSYTTFFSPYSFDLKPCAELQKKKGYLLTVLLSSCREKRDSTKCCSYSDRVRSALCSFFKSRHCSWRLSGETFICTHLHLHGTAEPEFYCTL